MKKNNNIMVSSIEDNNPMAKITIKQFVDSKDLSLDNVLQQLKDIGVVNLSDPSKHIITDEEQQQVLAKLANEDKNKKISLKRKSISLKRKSTSEVKVKRTSGKTVSVVRKRRFVYVERDAAKSDSLSVATDDEKIVEKPSKVKTTDIPIKQESAPKPVPEQIIEKKEIIAEEKTSEKPIEPISTVDTIKKPKEKAVKKKEKNKNKEKPKDKHKDEKRRRNTKQVLIKDDDDRLHRSRAKSNKKTSALFKDPSNENKHSFAMPTKPIVYKVRIPETITVAELAQKMSIKAAEVIKVMIKLGTMASINEVIDQATAGIIVEEMGHLAINIDSESIEDELNIIEEEKLLVNRAPIITVMGHVDHGKTSLLDYIRKSKVTSREAGGITQHIGAYHVKLPIGSFTFLDTPGHSAFTAMRARGAGCTDIVVLVVAADDGVMPQTQEAIRHAKAAKVPIIVAVNKMDKPESDFERIQNELSQYELIPEEWGGDTLFIPISAKAGTGIDNLLEAINLQAELLELKAPIVGASKGFIIESRLDKGRGPIATVLVQSGTLRKGDILLAGLEFGKVRGLYNENGKELFEAGPAIPIEVLGLSGVPLAGDEAIVAPNEKKAREIAIFRKSKDRDIRFSKQHSAKLEGFLDQFGKDDAKVINIVLKSDVQGSADALQDVLVKLSTAEVAVQVVSSGVGGINESDISLAMASNAVLIGFNVRADATARRLAQAENIEIYYHSIIYNLIDSIKVAISGLIAPTYKDNILGLAEVREVFRSSKFGAVAGCMIIEGNVKRGCPIRILRDNIVIYQGELESLRRFKEDALIVNKGKECGIAVKNYNDVKTGDQIECYEVVEVKPSKII